MAGSTGATFLSAFLDGFTGAGLFQELRIPGEPIIGFAPSPESREKPRESEEAITALAHAHPGTTSSFGAQ